MSAFVGHGSYLPLTVPSAGLDVSNVQATALRGAVLVTFTPADPSLGYTNYEINIDPAPVHTGNGNTQNSTYSGAEWLASTASAGMIHGQSNNVSSTYFNTIFGVPLRGRVRGWKPPNNYGPFSAFSSYVTSNATINTPITGLQTVFGASVGCNAPLTSTRTNETITIPGTMSNIDWQCTQGGPGSAMLVCNVGTNNTLTLNNVRVQCTNPAPATGVQGTYGIDVKSGNLVISNFEVDGGGIGGIENGIGNVNTAGTITASNGVIHSNGDQIHFGGGSGSFTDMILFDNCEGGSTHLGRHPDGIQMTGGGPWTFTRVDVRNSNTANSCFYCDPQPSTSTIAGFTMQDCLIDGGGFSIDSSNIGTMTAPFNIFGTRVRRAPYGFWIWGGFQGTSAANPGLIQGTLTPGMGPFFGTPDLNVYWEPNGTTPVGL